MKTAAASIIIVAGLFLARGVQAQGTIYLSNLDQSSSGSQTVSSDRWWLAEGFYTGANAGGYLLNSIQLVMLDASGHPAGGFSVMLYTEGGFSYAAPGDWLTTLNGSTDPSTAGIYTYTPASSFILLPNTAYYIVLAAETPYLNGYAWSCTGPTTPNPTSGWGLEGGTAISSDGIRWSGPNSRYGQFAITATPVPEPSAAWLLWLGSGIFFYVRKLRST